MPGYPCQHATHRCVSDPAAAAALVDKGKTPTRAVTAVVLECAPTAAGVL
jgi:hypothetical protein